MDSRLNAFLERADAVLARLEPLLPAPRQTIDWDHCLAARWQREGRAGFLLPLEVSLDMRLSDVDAPTAEEGRPIPVVFGTVLLRGANVVWYGDLEAEPIRKKGGKK